MSKISAINLMIFLQTKNSTNVKSSNKNINTFISGVSSSLFEIEQPHLYYINNYPLTLTLHDYSFNSN